MNYDVDYFIQKFEAISEDKWVTGFLGSGGREGQHCALGHCGVKDKTRVDEYTGKEYQTGNYDYSEEGAALEHMFKSILYFSVPDINDSPYHSAFKQNHPKYRILAALHEIKEKLKPIVAPTIPEKKVVETIEEEEDEQNITV